MLTTNLPYRQAITIPANSGNGATLRSLLTLPDRPFVQAEICALLPDGSNRSAIVVASPRDGAAITATDYTTHGRHRAAGEAHVVPGPRGLDDYVRSYSGSAITAIVEVL